MSHRLQLEELAAEYVPAEQDTHASVLSVYCPDGQLPVMIEMITRIKIKSMFVTKSQSQKL